MTKEEIIADWRYHTCGRCKYESIPDNEYPCNQCKWGVDYREDLWKLKDKESEEE